MKMNFYGKHDQDRPYHRANRAADPHFLISYRVEILDVGSASIGCIFMVIMIRALPIANGAAASGVKSQGRLSG